MTPTLLGDLVTDLLHSAVAVITLPPTRQMVVHGLWAHDCECVAAKVIDVQQETLVRPAVGITEKVNLAVTVLRCYATSDQQGQPPAAAAIQVDALVCAADLANLVVGLGARWEAGTLFPSHPEIGCGQVQFSTWRAIGPEGGFAGWEMTLIVEP